MVIRVLLADDHPMLRRGMRALLEKAGDIEVVGEAADGREALELVDELPADVLLLDVEMPEMDGMQVAREINKNEIPVRILALSAYDDNQYVLGMLACGAAGYLTKDEAPGLVVTAIRRVAAGEEGWLSRRVYDRISSSTDDSDLAKQPL
ncbi:MAG TPA: response regulator transcription factor [Anaerolineales bacterium]